MTENTREHQGKKQPVKENTSTTIYDFEQREEFDVITDIRTTILAQSPRGGRTIVWLTLLFLILFMYWMYSSEIEEVTRGMGKVIPSSQIQVVQNLEGGILEESFVRVGDIVKKGQLLMRLDETRFYAPYQESRVKYLALVARAARLKAETNGDEMVVPDFVGEERPDIVRRERQLYILRQQELDADIAILQEQQLQREQELEELKAKLDDLERTYSLLNKEINLTRPLIQQGAVSAVEVLRLERQASSMEGEIRGLRLAIPRVQSRMIEAKKIVQEKQLEFTNTAKEELNSVEVDLEAISSSAVALEDRLKRTAIRSPVHGTVKQVLINTVGGVVQPGMNLIEIVPLEDTLLVEAQIKPSDIAFLRPGQRAMVKFTAYDFTIYGGLEAEVEHISADSITDEKGNSFYLVRVRTRKNHLEGREGELPIIPGMVANIDIVTGKKTIMSYLLKPVLRAKEMALRER